MQEQHPSTPLMSTAHHLVFKVTKCRKRKKRESVRMVSQSGTALLCHPPLAQTKAFKRKASPWHMLKNLILGMAGMLHLWVGAVFSSARRSDVVRGYKRLTRRPVRSLNNLGLRGCFAILHDGCESTDRLVSATAFLNWGDNAWS